MIVSSYTSPIDALYLAAIFDPLFTRSFPGIKQVQQISLWQAMLDALSPPSSDPPIGSRLVDMPTLLKENSDQCIAIFPECTTSNGRGILPFSPSVLGVPEKVKIFPVSLRYTPADITTPVPGTYFTFLWNLCSRPTHTIRVRIAEATHNTSIAQSRKEMQSGRRGSYETNFLDTLQATPTKQNGRNPDRDITLSTSESEVLDNVGEALARLGRVKRVGLSVEDKEKFVQVWSKRR